MSKMKNKAKFEIEKIREIAYRIERYADRFENAGEDENARYAREIAEKIRNCTYLDKALLIEKKYTSKINKNQVLRTESKDLKDINGYS